MICTVSIPVRVRRTARGLGLVAVLLGLVGAGARARQNAPVAPPQGAPQVPQAGAAPVPAPAAFYASTVKPFLESNCTECHDDTTQKGGLRLDNLPADFSAPEVCKTWVDVFDKVSAGEMPPKKKPRPPEAQSRQVLAWLKGSLTAADLGRRAAAGRVALRRLNRSEYENTLRDLLAVDVDVKPLLPEDTSANGFDNNAAALNVSSVLMERYLEAADAALDEAVQTGPRPATRTWDVMMGPQTTNPNDYRLKYGVKWLADETFVYFNSGETPITCDRFKAPVEGDYHFRIPVYAYQSPGKPLTLSVMVGSFDPRTPKRRTVGFYDAPPDADHPRVIEFTEHLPRNGTLKIMAHELGRRGLQDASAYTGPGVAVKHIAVEGPLEQTWPPEGHRRLFGDLDFKKATAADAEKVLLDFAPHAFRRPVAKADVEPYLALVKEQLDGGQPFEAAIRVGLKGILCSPEFLFLTEQPGKLDDYAVASRLSCFLWSSMPDEALLKCAAEHSLTRPGVLRQQTERMLNDPRAGRFTEDFTGQWLGLRQIDFTTPDKRLYPDFDDLLQWSMVEETTRFFDEVLGKDLSLLSFVDSDFAMLNERLARHYGIAGVSGTDLRRVALPPGSHRGGVLGQAAVLKVTANGTNTSPVVRGAWVMRNILGRPPKPPPPNVPAIEPDTRGARTIREQLEKHRSIGQCASCHQKMDPAGNALESFDVIGGWRESYRTLAGTQVQVLANGSKVRVGPKVDPSDVLVDGRKFQNFDEFKKLLLDGKEQVARCLTEKLLVYATGAGLDFADREAVDEIVRHEKERGYGFRSLVHEVVQSRLFLDK